MPHGFGDGRKREPVLELTPLLIGELDAVLAMDQEPHASPFINPTPVEVHTSGISGDRHVYLGIRLDRKLVGYFILVPEDIQPDKASSVELRRILVSAGHRGIGQRSMQLAEAWCREKIGRDRIWLDVYEDNTVGRHIYNKLGYRQFDEELIDGRRLLFMEKSWTD